MPINRPKARGESPEAVNRMAYRQEVDRIDIEDARPALKGAAAEGTIPLRDLMRELGDRGLAYRGEAELAAEKASSQTARCHQSIER